MKLPPFEYREPDNFAELCSALSENYGDAQVIAGGTMLLPGLKYRLKSPKVLISLDRINGLDQTGYSAEEGLVIGASVTLRNLASDPSVKRHYPVLAAAAKTVGGAQLQAMGTVGGNLCQDACCIYYMRPPGLRKGWDPCYKLGGDVCLAVKKSAECWAVYSGDLAPVLLALGARIDIATEAGEKRIALEDLYSGNGLKPMQLGPGEVVKAIRVPAAAPFSGGAYLKLRLRKAIDYPLLGVAAVVTMAPDGKTVQNAAVAMTGIGTSPIQVKEASALQGHPITEEALDDLAETARGKAKPVANALGYSPRYRRDMVRVYVKQAVRQAAAAAV